jgi:hypothetical protein
MEGTEEDWGDPGMGHTEQVPNLRHGEESDAATLLPAALQPLYGVDSEEVPPQPGLLEHMRESRGIAIHSCNRGIRPSCVIKVLNLGNRDRGEVFFT